MTAFVRLGGIAAFIAVIAFGAATGMGLAKTPGTVLQGVTSWL